MTVKTETTRENDQQLWSQYRNQKINCFDLKTGNKQKQPSSIMNWKIKLYWDQELQYLIDGYYWFKINNMQWSLIEIVFDEWVLWFLLVRIMKNVKRWSGSDWFLSVLLSFTVLPLILILLFYSNGITCSLSNTLPGSVSFRFYSWLDLFSPVFIPHKYFNF